MTALNFPFGRPAVPKAPALSRHVQTLLVGSIRGVWMFIFTAGRSLALSSPVGGGGGVLWADILAARPPNHGPPRS
jgi:hypothetical protein